MMTKETIAAWVAKNKNTLFLVGCVVLGQVIFYLANTTKRIAGRVGTVLLYSNGVQKVRLANGEPKAVVLNANGHYYIQAGDSVVQEAGSKIATIYRQFSTYTEVSVFGPGRADFPGAAEYTGLMKRYQIKKP